MLIGIMVHNFDYISFLGKLPGDIRVKGERFSFYFPTASGLLICIVLSLIIYLINKYR